MMPRGVDVFVGLEPIDLRWSFDRLAGVVERLGREVRISLIASCKLNGLEPEAYLGDLFRVLPHWPKDRCLELAPLNFAATRARLDARELEDEVGALSVPQPA